MNNYKFATTSNDASNDQSTISLLLLDYPSSNRLNLGFGRGRFWIRSV